MRPKSNACAERSSLARLVVAVAVVLTMASASAVVDAAEPPSLVVWVVGPQHDAARAGVVAAMGGTFLPADPATFLASMGRDAHVNVGASLRSRASRARLVSGIRRAARASGTDDVVVVAIDAKGAGASVLSVDAASGEVSTTRTTRDALGDTVKRELRKVHATPPVSPSAAPSASLSGSTASSAAASTGATTAVASAPPASGSTNATNATKATGTVDPSEHDAPDALSTSGDGTPQDHASPHFVRPLHEVGYELVEVSLGAGAGARHFNYRDGLTPNLRDYRLGAAPVAALEAALYPLQGGSLRALADLGIIGGYARAFALQSVPVDGAAVGTSWSRYDVGARFRVRTGGGAHSPLLGLSFSYGDETFSLASSALTGGPPSVDYRFLRPALDARIPIGRAAIFARAGYLFLLSSGAVADRFPHASVGGVDGRIGGALEIVPGLEARLTGSYRRFFYSMHPVPGDAYVAGGALDELAGLEGSLAYVY